MRWDGRRLILDEHTLPRMDLAELPVYVALLYHRNIPQPPGLDIFTQGLARVGAETRHIGN